MKVSEQMIKEFTESFDYVRVVFEKTRLSKKKIRQTNNGKIAPSLMTLIF